MGGSRCLVTTWLRGVGGPAGGVGPAEVEEGAGALQQWGGPGGRGPGPARV